MTRILAVADQVEERLDRTRLLELRPDLILACGDLPYGYLDFLVSTLNVPLLYVPGNHDPDLRPGAPTLDIAETLELEPRGPAGCVNVHGHLHPVSKPLPDRQLGSTTVVNAVGHRLLVI